MRERATTVTAQVRQAGCCGRPRFERTLPGLGARRDPRARLRATVEVLPLDGRHPASVAVSEDISRRGIFMSTETEYPIGTMLHLMLSTDHGELALTGRVVHRLKGIGVGCEFLDLEEREHVALAFLSSRRGLGPVQ
jgi:hypothetical protein